MKTLKIAISTVIAIVLLLTITNKTVVEEVEHIDLQTYNTLLQKKVEWCKNDKDCKAMLKTLYHEARGESDEGVKAVAQVIINRAAHPTMWKDTIHDVIHEPWQFSYLWDGSVKRGMKDDNQVRRMAIIAYDAINGTIETPAKNAVFYHTRYIKNPLWARNNCIVTTIGSHVFYKERSKNGECK